MAHIVEYDVSSPEFIYRQKRIIGFVTRCRCMEITPYLFSKILAEAAELGALYALILAGNIKPYLKKSEAFKRYGRAAVENWLRSGMITPRKDGDHSAAWRLELIELELLEKSIRLIKEW